MRSMICCLSFVLVVSFLVSPVVASTLAFYQMNEGAGSAIADSSNFGRNAAMSPDLAAQAGNWTAGPTGYGNAVNFVQGVVTRTRVDWVNVNDPLLMLSNGAFTVEAWINPAGFAADEYLFTLGAYYGTTLSVRWDPSLTSNVNSLVKLTVGAGVSDASITLSDSLQAGVWQHFALVYSETGTTTSKYEIYKNGVNIGGANLEYRIASNPDQVHLGGYDSIAWYRQYRGGIDEFKISDLATIPEPVTIVLLGLGGLFLARNSKKSNL